EFEHVGRAVPVLGDRFHHGSPVGSALPGDQSESGYWKTSSSGTPKTRAIRKATSSDGEYRPCSMAITVCRVTPTRSASSAWVISPWAKRRARMLLVTRVGLTIAEIPPGGRR